MPSARSFIGKAFDRVDRAVAFPFEHPIRTAETAFGVMMTCIVLEKIHIAVQNRLYGQEEQEELERQRTALAAQQTTGDMHE